MRPSYTEISRECSGRNGTLVDPWWLTCRVTHISRGVTGAVIVYQRLHALSARPDEST